MRLNQHTQAAWLTLTALLLFVAASFAAQPESAVPSQPDACRLVATPGKTSQPSQAVSHASLTMLGLHSPAVVSGTISVSVTGPPGMGSVTYCLDGVALQDNSQRSSSAAADTARILSLSRIAQGTHRLSAVTISADAHRLRSDPVTLEVVPTLNDQFSSTLTPFALQPSALQPLADLLKHIATAGAQLTPEEEETRRAIAAMFMNFGFDLSLDYAADQSTILQGLLPSRWAPPSPREGSTWGQMFSPDAPFFKAVPANWPRVRLPRGYISTIQLNTSQGGDGIGYGVAVAQSDSPLVRITSQWFDRVSTRRIIDFRTPVDWSRSLPRLAAGDRHMIFIDPANHSFVSAYKTQVDPHSADPVALYASPVTPFNSLGDHGGSTAAGFAELPLLLWPGEATSESQEIQHALGGPVSRTWAARVYPATSRDSGMLTSANSCPGKGNLLTNTGLVPYGAIIQLDPSLDLAHLGLSRPAQRILRAIQVYGYYVMDFGCADLDIYTAVDEKEFAPFGGLYGWNAEHAGVQGEIAHVLSTQALFVVAPLVKRP